MMQVSIIQFLRPTGRQVVRNTELSDRFQEAYDDMIAHGYRFETEILSTGAVSTTISDEDGTDLDSRLTPNGPEVQAGMEAMLQSHRWTQQLTEIDDTATQG